MPLFINHCQSLAYPTSYSAAPCPNCHISGITSRPHWVTRTESKHAALQAAPRWRVWNNRRLHRSSFDLAQYSQNN